ncbi:CoA ester lyase [Bradyrhizobium sp. 183]|uniref:HpcH/HpaI aldolase/citrate lyase family protein n=1 Tax=unclassified Bradyrhizobium TaxID=2631580 RepID=UPI00200048C8|nr:MULTISPECIES: CoA ester lyase [unclassified Bradyrhizobium]UPJ79247.1 CoA ester lyase [Bradyrhizobium sp. 184]UPJ87040.1 CoA ester lyase [Bradyrhizobium sp. 183]
MPQTFREARWYRSMLYVPGNKLDWMLKAPKYGADALIFDLEDSVEVSQKAEARKAVAAAIKELSTGPFGRFVRLNGSRTGCLLDDLNAVVIDGLDGVALAKTEDPEDIAALDLLLGNLESSRNMPVGRIEICPHAESAVGMYRMYHLCMASQRVKRAGCSGGPTPGGDGARSLGLQLNDFSDEGIYFGAYSALQARAAGILHVEGAMTARLDDLELVRRIGERSKRMGASWASAIHPTHIPIINEIYSPSQDEINWARDIVSVVAEATTRGEAAIRYKSTLLDYAHVRTAMNVLKKAQVLGIDVANVPKLELPPL